MLVDTFPLFLICASLKTYHIAVCILVGFALWFSRGVELMELIYTS